MASRRSWTDPTVRSGDARPKRIGGFTDAREDASHAMSQIPRKEVGDVTTTAYHAYQTKVSTSRIPQTSSHVRPSLPGMTDRPLLNHQPQSWGSAGSVGSGRSAGNLTQSSASPSGSNVPAPGSSRRRNLLRRKHSGLSENKTNHRTDSNSDSARTSSSSSVPRSQNSVDASPGVQFDRGLTESPMEVRMAQRVDLPKTTAHTVTIYPELDRYRDVRPPTLADNPNIDVPFRIATHDLPPPTPQFSGTGSQISGFSGSPSTRWSESPGPGPYSRDTTPTSISSQSPGLLAPIRFPTPARARQASPAQTRPPVTRRRAASIPNEVDPISADAQGLAAVRESLTSSSSNSTVRDADKKDIKKKKKRLSPLPPSPPPRTSSQKLRSRSHSQDEGASPLKWSRGPGPAVMKSQPPAKATSSSRKEPLTSPKATAPSRPSRDGTPDLQSQLGLPMPVIQSNLSSASLSDRRHSSLLSASSHSRALNPSPGPEQSQAQRRPSFSQQSALPEASRPTIRTPSPSVSAFKTRFPLFGRRTKTTASETLPQEKKDKPTRKGPAAGTGHEGYGRLGTARRRSGSISNLVRGHPVTVSSQESLTSNQTGDPFLMERIAPVVIAGGEVIENQNTGNELNRTESDQSLSVALSGIGSRNSSRVSLSSKESARLTLWPSAFPRGGNQTPSIGSRRPSDSSDSEAVAMKTTLAFRRSMQKLKAGDQQAPRLPKPIITRAGVISPSVTSLDASVMSDDSVFSPPTGPARGRTQTSAPSTTNPKKLTKRVRSPRRWNFFGRSQSQPAVVSKKPEPAASTVAATVQAVQSKPAAFYTMDFSEQEDTDVPDLEEVLREARAMASPFSGSASPSGRRPSASDSLASEPRSQNTLSSQQGTTRERRPSAGRAPSREGRIFGYPSPQIPTAGERRPSFSRPLNRPAPPEALNPPAPRRPQLRPTQTAPPPRSLETSTASSPGPSVQPGIPRPVIGRPSRLPQVGRIPKVVSVRPEQTSPKSFSRPFNRISVQLTTPRTEVPTPIPDTDFVAKGPSPPRPSTPELTQDESSATGGTNQSLGQVRQSREFPDPFQGAKEFLSFSPRKNSQNSHCTVTTSSSSSGILSFADATAIVPDSATPLAEDEIWDEYNDLLGEDTIKVPPSAGSSLGRPFHLEIYGTQLASKTVEQSLESPTVHLPETRTVDAVLSNKPEPVTSSLYSTDITADIKEAIDAAPALETTLSVTDIVSGLRDDRKDSMDVSEQGEAQRSSTSSKSHVRDSRRSDASGSSQGSEDNSPLSQVNLRVGSMTVSKWLTFGHVLFSPAREDLIQVVGSLKRHSILVIDGLGNDDWGFYAAETYPAATFFNLSPRAPLPADHQNSSGFPLSPPNHHQIQYTSYIDKFPFGAQSFTSVVFRFPTAAPESHYRNIVSEARRVLKPGGYIELAILDVDLNNMGNRGRRTIRRLKERIHANAPDTCLGSAADLILRLLGRKGFVDIKTCRVGVPVASAIARRSSTSGTAGKGSPTSQDDKASKSKERRDERTLAEMMTDESAVADESITKMVAKVGRWWYSQCYENAAAASPGLGGNKSMWSDKALLAECEEWGTSLKLMVCHARVPESRGRVASI